MQTKILLHSRYASKEKKNQRWAIRCEFEPIGPIMLKNLLGARWVDMRVYYHDPNFRVLVLNNSTGFAFLHMDIN
jgi:hypothetical protein